MATVAVLVLYALVILSEHMQLTRGRSWQGCLVRACLTSVAAAVAVLASFSLPLVVFYSVGAGAFIAEWFLYPPSEGQARN